jgi:hypothetical protein
LVIDLGILPELEVGLVCAAPPPPPHHDGASWVLGFNKLASLFWNHNFKIYMRWFLFLTPIVDL